MRTSVAVATLASAVVSVRPAMLLASLMFITDSSRGLRTM
jgi:hypothetical protein